MPQKQHNWTPLFPKAQAGGTEVASPDLRNESTSATVSAPSAPPQIGTTIKVKRGTDANAGGYGNSIFNTGLTEALSPFSARDASGNWQIPPIIKGGLDIMRQNFPSNSANMRPADPMANASAAYHSFADPVGQIATGDSNAKAEGFGKLISQLIPMFLTSEALQSDVVKNAPRPPALGPAPPAPAEPPVIDVPFKPVPKTGKPLAEGPSAPKALPAGNDVGNPVFAAKEGGIPKRGEQTVTPTPIPHLSVRDAATGKFRKMTGAEFKAFADKLVSAHSDIGKSQTPKPSTRFKPKGTQ